MAYEVEMHPLSRMSPYISVMSVITVMVARQRLTYAVYSMTVTVTMTDGPRTRQQLSVM